MTKYVLNSGNVSGSADKGKRFFDEVLKGFGKNPKLLVCCFAQPREDWEGKFAESQRHFDGLYGNNICPILTLAFPEGFERQIADNDAVYIRGGDDHLVQYWLRQFDLPRIWEGKTIATNSASSHALARHFWTCDWRECMDGLGIVPVKFLAHFRSDYGKDDPRGPIDWDSAYAELEKYGENLPIHALKEGDYETFEI